MKKIIVLIILFIIYAIIVNTCPAVTQWDRSAILAVQDMLKDLPVTIPDIAGGGLYKCGIYIPLIAGITYFFRKYLLIDIILFSSAPALGYFLNKFIIKNIVGRPRPPVDMQLIVHKTSFSFTSNHTVVTSVLWGLVIYYLLKYCKNKILKICGITFSGLWIICEGFSRVWLGVHYPTDVIGGYLLALILILVYIKLIRLIGGKC
jgi:membrane-associated phospholipid phosphatase